MLKQKDFYKCGEIMTSFKVGKHVFELNCIFCEAISLQFEAFALHIDEKHHNEFFDEENQMVYEHDDSDNGINLQQQPVVESEHEEKFTHMLENKNEITIDSEDPLQESHIHKHPSVLAMCVVKHENNVIENKEEWPLRAMEETKKELSTDDDMDGTFEELENINSSDSESEVDDSEVETDGSNKDILESDTTNNEMLPVLIAGYKKHPLLWDSKDPNTKNRKKREDALKRIAQAIKRKTKVNMSTKSIGEQIKKIRYKFRRELQNQSLAVSNGVPFTSSLWYFDQLAFLNKTIKYKPRNKRGAKALANEKPALPLTSLTETQNLQLIDIYKSFPCLWDMQHIGFRFKTQRSIATEEMLQEIKVQMKLNLTPDDLQKKLYRIRYACTQEKHRKLQCERSQKEFKPASNYFEHISFLVDNVGPFKCNFCEETFNGADQYRIHKSKHDGSMPFICPICNRGFMKVGNCTVHVRRHTRDYPFECKECGKRFATTTDVNVHMRYHTGEKPYFCEVCGQSFRTWSFFDAHMRRHQKRPSHTCTICSKAFYENNKLTEHMKAHLNVRDKVCNICGKAFTSSKYLRQHKQIHAEKKKYVCKICNKDFAQYAGLSGHMKSHGTTVSGGVVADDIF